MTRLAVRTDLTSHATPTTHGPRPSLCWSPILKGGCPGGTCRAQHMRCSTKHALCCWWAPRSPPGAPTTLTGAARQCSVACPCSPTRTPAPQPPPRPAHTAGVHRARSSPYTVLMMIMPSPAADSDSRITIGNLTQAVSNVTFFPFIFFSFISVLACSPDLVSSSLHIVDVFRHTIPTPTRAPGAVLRVQ